MDYLAVVALRVILIGILAAMMLGTIYPSISRSLNFAPPMYTAGAEDDCLYYYQGKPLTDVVGVNDERGHHVECRY